MKRITVFMMALLIVSVISAQADKIGEWHFDEGSGNIAYDSSGYGNHGTIFIAPAGSPPHIHSSGATWIDDGISGSALNLDGYFDWVNFGNGVTSQISSQGTRDYTVAAWIRPSSFPAGRNAAMSFTAMEFGQTSGRVWFRQAYGGWPSGYSILSGSVLEIGEWTHIVGVHHEDVGIDLYVDGIYIGSDNTKTGLDGNATIRHLEPTHAGVWYGTTPSIWGSAWFDGDIDEISMYNHALTAEEIAALASRECVEPPANLVSWWPGDGDAVDIQGGNNGTLVNDAAFVDGKVEQAFSLDGFNDYVQVPASVSLNEVGKTGFTVDAWVKLESGYPIITKHRERNPNNPNTEGWLLSAYQNNFHLQLRAGGVCCQTLTSTVVWVADRWYHVAGTYNGTEARLYVDGVLESSLQVSGDTSSTIDINIGRDVNTETHFLNGIVDEVEIFNRALSQEEIQAIYNAGSAGKCKVEPNQPPVAVCQDITIECQATITPEDVDGGSNDPDGDSITLSVDNMGPFSLGDNSVNLTVTDDNGASNTCVATVTVVDTTPPIIGSFTVDPDVLRPPNHKMVRIYPTITVNDNCGSDPRIVYTITMDEGDETDTYDAIYDSTLGDGHTTNDFRVEENGEIYVRAERSGKGTGRTYIITCTATDASGNSTIETATVTVPHDQKK